MQMLFDFGLNPQLLMLVGYSRVSGQTGFNRIRSCTLFLFFNLGSARSLNELNGETSRCNGAKFVEN